MSSTAANPAATSSAICLVLRAQIDQRDRALTTALRTACSRPWSRIERSIASSARTTAAALGAADQRRLAGARCTRGSGRTRRCSGSPVATLGIVMSPSRMLARNDANVSTTAASVACVGHLLVVDAQRLEHVHVVEGQHPLVADDGDVAGLARVQPGGVQVDQHVARVAQRREDRVLDARR